MLEGCRNNQRSSQKLLYEWLKDYGVNICYRYTSNYHEIEELISEGFIKVFKNIQLYDENLYGINEATFKGWFKRILINTCIDAFRKKHSATSMPFVDPETVQHEDKSATALDNISYKEIIEAIRELSPVYRTVFNLFAVEGMSHEEIAGHLGISVGTSKSNLFKAKENLKKILQKKMNYSLYA